MGAQPAGAADTAAVASPDDSDTASGSCASSASEGDGGCCWICLGGASASAPLATPCDCPRPVHPRCLARWQLQQAGRAEERACRFCGRAYGDWRAAIAATGGAQANLSGGACPGAGGWSLDDEAAAPVMAVRVRGRIHKVRVRLGPEGKEAFRQQVRELLGYDSSADFDVVFECKVPASGEKVQLTGFEAFEAAAHCAAISAARRAARKREQHLADEERARRAVPAPAAADWPACAHPAGAWPVGGWPVAAPLAVAWEEDAWSQVGQLPLRPPRRLHPSSRSPPPPPAPPAEAPPPRARPPREHAAPRRRDWGARRQERAAAAQAPAPAPGGAPPAGASLRSLLSRAFGRVAAAGARGQLPPAASRGGSDASLDASVTGFTVPRAGAGGAGGAVPAACAAPGFGGAAPGAAGAAGAPAASSLRRLMRMEFMSDYDD